MIATALSSKLETVIQHFIKELKGEFFNKISVFRKYFGTLLRKVNNLRLKMFFKEEKAILTPRAPFLI